MVWKPHIHVLKTNFIFTLTRRFGTLAMPLLDWTRQFDNGVKESCDQDMKMVYYILSSTCISNKQTA